MFDKPFLIKLNFDIEIVQFTFLVFHTYGCIIDCDY